MAELPRGPSAPQAGSPSAPERILGAAPVQADGKEKMAPLSGRSLHEDGRETVVSSAAAWR